MGSMKEHINSRGNSFPLRAQRLPVLREVPDYAYVECEEPPDLDHGIVWAHRVDASPPDMFGELMAWMDKRLEQIKENDANRRASWSELIARRRQELQQELELRRNA